MFATRRRPPERVARERNELTGMTFPLRAGARRAPVAARVATLCVALVAAFCQCAPALAAPMVVIDAASGQVLEQEQATASWYPASTTKLMTVYVALDAVRNRRITLDTPIAVSPRAAKMAPSKMGFKPGTEVTLRNALVMLMVKSANDIAVSVAEGVSGSVEAFADDMNRASASLGMTQSHWVNPNGLPDSRHVTSARDLAILGRALLVDFPEYAWLYNVGAMQIGGRLTGNHNGLLGRYPGADGMKTGFTCPAGFNVVASATRGGRRVIAVVLGAPTAAARTAMAATLFDRAFQGAAPQGPIASLPAFGVAAAPDMRDKVCRRRGKATQEYMAEVENLAAAAPPAASGPLGFLSAAQAPQVAAKDVAHLPRPQFEPVEVYVGRAPGYDGPVARIRPAGTPVGTDAPVSAYASEPAEEAASPVPAPAGARKSLRGRGGHRQQAKAASAEPAADAAEARPKKRRAAKVAAEKPGSKAGKHAALVAGHKGKSEVKAKGAEKRASADKSKGKDKSDAKEKGKGKKPKAGKHS
jgi:D-alanyl-D-alanine carboxypeptidase